MIKSFLFVIFFGVSIFSNLFAEEREIELSSLFEQLKMDNTIKVFKVEQKIWKIWSTHPTDKNLTSKLKKGSDLVRNQKLAKAISIFTQVIELDPSWAEAWNKRATVLYLMGKYELSQADIDKVLMIEKRHFGALTGQGLVQTALKNYQKAIDSYIEAHKVHPFMKSPMIMIEKLQIELQKQSI